MIAIDVCRRCTRATAILVAAVLLHTSLPFDALGLGRDRPADRIVFVTGHQRQTGNRIDIVPQPVG